MPAIIETPAAQIVAPVSDRRYAAPPVQHPVANPARLRVRVHAENPNHHLWNNHGTWFLHYTVHPTPFTKQRVRRSLGTASLAAARERRDAFFAHWQPQIRSAPVQAVA